jgi:hypothetical protein
VARPWLSRSSASEALVFTFYFVVLVVLVVLVRIDVGQIKAF